MKKIAASTIALITVAATLHAEVKPNSLFGDNAVLQRGKPIPVWGTAQPGETVTVTFDGQKVSTVAQNGNWRVRLKSHTAGGPFTLTIAGDNNVVNLTNILVGDVWIASGQSNMEDPLGPTWWAAPVSNWQNEVASANYPQIRQFFVPKVLSYKETNDVNGTWDVCSPQTAGHFSAAGYFFARDLQKSVNVPIGILFSAWGGTIAEAWTSADALQTMPDFTAALAKMNQTDPAQYPQLLETWYQQNDPGTTAQPAWSDPAMDDSTWKSMNLPTYWQHAPNSDLANYNGIVWYRKEITLPDSWSGKAAVLHLGPIDDQDTTWVNGVQVGAMNSFGPARNYDLPASVLKPGKNIIAIRVLDTGGLGGVYGQPQDMRLEIPNSSDSIPLAGDWQYSATTPLGKLSPMPLDARNNPNIVTVLYKGMIEPLQPYPFTGVIWYQGESNDDNPAHARQYRTLFPLMISDWRHHWDLGNFPFLFVQIAPFQAMTPEIREAQLLTFEKTPNTGMAIITDAGEAQNIHPANKQIVGARLALAARALAYHEKVEYEGPIFHQMKIHGHEAILSFTHLGGGLVAKDGPLRGFTIAGADKNFVPATAEIRGNKIIVTSDQVSQPVAVRYAWSNVPDVNLYNEAGLPASPFRTDVD